MGVPSTGTQTTTTSISPGPGAPENGDVDLGTGQVRLSVPLASLSAGPEVRYNLALSYSSAGAASAGVWNIDMPTGLAGLGWAIDKDCVVRMPSEAASDMNVVLVLSGGAYPLVKTGSDADGDIYVSQAYQPWVIRYVAASEQWVVIQENGVRYLFGGILPPTPDGKASVGSSIEWAVRRGNWIGDSPAGGQEQMAMVWNLSAQEDPWGNRLAFVYDQTLVYVGPTGADRKKYTRSCRLSEVSSSDGTRVTLAYAAKDPCEYRKPHLTKTRKITGVFNAEGDWDPLNRPDPHIQAWVDGTQCYDQAYDNTRVVPFGFDVPTSSTDVVQVRFKAMDVDPLRDDPMMDTVLALTLNQGVKEFTQPSGKESAAVRMEYTGTPEDAPDAFQDRYEEHYLSGVSLQAAGSTVVDTRLGFVFLGSGDTSKRLLTTVSRQNAQGQLYEPPLRFEYHTTPLGPSGFDAPTGALYGAIKSRTLPTGATISYRYSRVDIGSAPLDIEIKRPQNDSSKWVNPRTYAGPEYNLVIWDGKSGTDKAKKIHVSVYAWVGCWAVNDLGEVAVDNASEILVLPGTGLVALGLPRVRSPLVLIGQDPLDPARWTMNGSLLDSPSYTTVTPLVAVGNGFAAFLDPGTGSLSIFERSGADWVKKDYPLENGSGTVFTLAAQDHYVFALGAAPRSPQSQAYLLRRLVPFDWQLVKRAVSSPWRPYPSVTAVFTLSCQSSATFVVVQGDESPTSYGGTISVKERWVKHFAYRFTGDALGFVEEALGDTLTFSEPTIVLLNVIADIVSIDVVAAGVLGDLAPGSSKHLYRFVGTQWKRDQLRSDSVTRAYYGSDACTTTWNGTAQYRQFDPNIVEWQSRMPPFQDGNPTLFERWWPVVSLLGGVATLPLGGWTAVLIDLAFLGIEFILSQPNDQAAGGVGAGRYFTAGNNVYHQDNYGDWALVGPLAPTYQGKYLGNGFYEDQSLAAQSTQNASRYISYVVTVDQYRWVGDNTYAIKQHRTGYPKQVHRVQCLQNGQRRGDPIDLPAGQSIQRSSDGGETPFIGPESFFSYSGGATLSAATGLHLYRFDRSQFEGAQTAYVVSRVVVDDGLGALCSEYEYDAADAIPSAVGGTVRFGKVTTYFPGALGAPAKTNGYRECYFYTRSTTPPLSPQAPDDLRKYASLFSGTGYATRVLGPDDAEIALSTQKYEVFEVPLLADSPGTLTGYFMRPTERTAVAQGARTVTRDTFSVEAKGLLVRSEIVSCDLSGVETRVVTEYTYAFLEPAYADLIPLNLLTGICQEKRSVGGQTTAISAVQWEIAGSARTPSLRAPSKTYRALRPDAVFDFGRSTVDIAAWVCTGTVLCRDTTHGVVTEAANVTGLVRSTVHDLSFRFELATFLNARVSQGEAGYYGYQGYEDTAPWILTTSGSTQRVEPQKFSPRAGATAYVVSAYVQPSVTGACGSIGFASSSTDKTDKTDLTGTAGVWQYVEHVTTSPSAAKKPYVECKGLIRDFRFSPVDAPFAAAVYDGSNGRVVSEIDDNGLKIERNVDELLRPVADVEPQGTVHRLTWQVGGAWGSGGFSRGQRFVFSNRSGGRYVAGPERYTTVIVDQNRGNSAIQMRTKNPIDPKAVPTQEFTVGLEIGSIQAVYGKNRGYDIELWDNGSKKFTYTPTAPFSKWLLVALDTKVWLWIDDVLVTLYTASTAVTGNLSVISYHDGVVPYEPQQIYASIDPIITAVYSDALGRPVQVATLNDDATGLVVEQTLYDGWGNPAVRTKPMLYSDLWWKYQPNCVTAFDAQSGVMQGDVANYYRSQTGETAGPDDWSYPYTRVLAEPNPMNRIIATGLPGKDFRVGAACAARVDHGPNADVTALVQRLGLGASQAWFSSRTTYAPDGVPVVALFDPIKRLVAASVGSGSAARIETSQVSYPSGVETTAHLPPAAYQGTFPADVLSRDFLGSPAQRVTPDAGTTRVVCDHAGRVRFFQSQAQIDGAPRTVPYCKYDALGRLVERGILTDTPWDRAALVTLAEDPSFPDAQTPGCEWREQYQYDITDTHDTTHLKGRLYRSVKRASASSGKVVETFAYDAKGNPITATLLVEPYDATTRTTNVTYDGFGNITSIAYPHSGSKASLTITHAFTLLGRVQSVGVSGTPEKYAAYQYDLQGRVSQVFLNNRKLARAYRYDFQGHLVQLLDKLGINVLFQEDLSYLDASGSYLAGRIAQASFTGSAVATPYGYAYSYAPQGWLLEASRTPAPSGAIQYDVQGNVQHLANVHGVRDATYAPGKDQIQTVQKGPSTISYTYTPDGKVSGSDKIASAVYDPLVSMPVGYTIAGSTNTVSFTYDCRTQRVLKSASGASARLYLHGPGSSLPLAEISGSTQTNHVFGLEGMVASIEGSTTRFVLRDHLGSTRAVTDVNGNPTYQFHFEPFGTLLPGSSEASSFRYLFTGQEHDPEADLYNYRLRIYDQDMGVFYATDPAGESYSPYTYVRNDPIDRTDPSGGMSLRAVWRINRLARQDVTNEALRVARRNPVFEDMNPFHPVIVVARNDPDMALSAYKIARAHGYSPFNVVEVAQEAVDLNHNGTMILVMHGSTTGYFNSAKSIVKRWETGPELFDHLARMGMMKRVHRVEAESCFSGIPNVESAWGRSPARRFYDAWFNEADEIEKGYDTVDRLQLENLPPLTMTARRGAGLMRGLEPGTIHTIAGGLSPSRWGRLERRRPLELLEP